MEKLAQLEALNHSQSLRFLSYRPENFNQFERGQQTQAIKQNTDKDDSLKKKDPIEYFDSK